MEYLISNISIDLCPGAFPLSTDSMVLADFVGLPRNAGVLDLGSGCGTLGLLLCGRYDSCHVTGVELERNAHVTALENITRNRLENRLYSVCADLRSIPLSPGSFDCCVSNPPYFSGGETSKKTPLARRDDFCSSGELFKAASAALKFGGDFFLVHKPERLGQLCGEGYRHGLEPKRLALVRHRDDGPVSLILIQFRKGGKPGMTWEEFALYRSDGSPTEDYRRIYHL